MRCRISGVHVVKIVGRDERKIECTRDLQEVVTEAGLDLEPVIHQLAEVIACAEDVAEVSGSRKCLVVVACLQPAVDLAARAAGGADEALAVALEKLSVEARLVVVPLEAGE